MSGKVFSASVEQPRSFMDEYSSFHIFIGVGQVTVHAVD
jgi:hypothetical protein